MDGIDAELHQEQEVPDLVFAEAAADGPADWLLIAALPGGDVIQVPVAPARSKDWRRCRPIGIYQANSAQRALYERERKQ